jgi:predicted nucleic acid-binding protein
VAIFAIDTSCIVAAVCAWHEHHDAAAAEIDRRIARGEHLAVPAPALVEAYAVLTRLPAPHRLSAADAWRLISANFVEGSAVVALTGAAHAHLLQQLARLSIAGGRTYDAVIAACARRGKADTLVTLNARHFDVEQGLSIVDPSAVN